MIKKICAIVFLALISVLGVGAAVRIGLYSVPEYRARGGGLPSAALSFVMDAERNLQQQIPRQGNWIDLFGGVMRLTGTDAVSDVESAYTVYKMKNGSFAFIHAEESTPLNEKQIASVGELKRTADALGAKSWFISVPQKTCTRDEALAFTSRGVTDNAELIDASRRQAFASCGFSVLDLHGKMHEQPGLHGQLYFKTDHHWTAQAGLWAAQQIADALSLPTEPLDKERFTEKVYPRAMFGSQGHRCGRLYCAQEDISVPIPQTDAAFSVSADHETVSEGGFIDAMLFPKNLEGYIYDRYPYGLFLGRDRALVSIRNLSSPDGTKVLVLKDSFSNAVAPYLALVCAQVDMIDARYYTGDVTEWIRQNKPDAVLVMMSAVVDNESFVFSENGGDS